MPLRHGSGSTDTLTSDAADNLARHTSTRGTSIKGSSTIDASGEAARLRAELGARREAGTLLAEASAVRDLAVAEADALVAEAQQLSDRLVTESRERSEGIITHARTEASRLTIAAHTEADHLRRSMDLERERARAEARSEALAQVTSLQVRAEQLVAAIERGVGGLSTLLEGASSAAADLNRWSGDLAEVNEAMAAVAPAPARSELRAPAPDVETDPVDEPVLVVDQPDAVDDDGEGIDDVVVVVHEADLPDSDDLDSLSHLEDDEPADPVELADLADLVEPADLAADEPADLAGDGPVDAPSSLPEDPPAPVAHRIAPAVGGGRQGDLESALVAARPLGWLFRGN